jgi:hypothetical protein
LLKTLIFNLKTLRNFRFFDENFELTQKPAPQARISTPVLKDAFTGTYIAEKMKECIVEIEPSRVLGFMSDHASNMRSAWKIIERDFPWIITSGCKGHALHLACSDLLNIPVISQLINLCIDFVKFFTYVLNLNCQNR